MNWNRLWPASGIVYAVLLALPFLTDGSSGTTDADITGYYEDAGHRVMDIALFFDLLLAGLALVVFATCLRLAIRSAADTWLADLAFGAGLTSAALLVVTGAIWVSGSAAHGDENFVVDPNTFRLIGTVGYWLFAASATVGGLLALATSLAALRHPLMWRWLAWTGTAIAVSTLAAVAFVPVIAYLAWIVLLSVALIAGAGERSHRQAQALTVEAT